MMEGHKYYKSSTGDCKINMIIVLVLILLPLPFSMASVTTTNLSIAAWNMRCSFDIAQTYLQQLGDKADIIAVSEHGLFPCELNKLEHVLNDYASLSKASAQLSDANFGDRAGIGGCAILWNTKRLNCKVKPHPDVGSDRICMIEINGIGDRNIFLIAVYMPHQSCKISDFCTELRHVENILNEFQPKGTCIIIGDFNINFAASHGSRCSGRSSLNSERFIRAMDMHGMVVADIGEKGNGPNYSYSGWHGTSYLDHVAVPASFMNYVKDCIILPDCIENVSDHLPIILNTQFILQVPYNDKINRRVSWHKLSESEIGELYTCPLEQMCRDIFLDAGYDPEFIMKLPEYCGCYDTTVLECIIDKLSRAVIECADNLPYSKFDKSLKPYWDDELATLNKNKKRTRSQWVQSGGLREKNDVTYNSYIDAKKEFRRIKRRKVYEYESKNMEDLCQTQEIDQRYFWFVINKKKRRGVSPIFSDNGELLTDTDSIVNEWNRYYQDLYSEGNNENFDDNFKEKIEAEVSLFEKRCIEMPNCMYLHGGPISYNETLAMISKLKNRKAPGWDKITAEHLKNGGTMLISALVWTMNGMVRMNLIPSEYKKGLVVSIPKVGKDSTVKANNRGIMLLSTLYKLFEKLMLERESIWAENAISNIQSCGKKHVSCLHTSLLVQQAVAHNLNRGETVYGAFLDTQKAFDTVWVKGLLHKLYESNMNPKVWLLIRSAYTQFKCSALVDGQTGEWFTQQRGVHQGAPLSMFLYTVYINDLLETLMNNDNGLSVHNIKLTSPAHADDIALLALYKKSLNILLDIAYKYSLKWRYHFNTLKTVLMIWGADSNPTEKIVFGDNTLNTSSSCKHMGVSLGSSVSMCKEFCAKRVGAGRSILYASRGIGSSTVPLAPSVLSKIYWTVSVPKMIYGVEVTPINSSCIETLENAHRHHARVVQNLPHSTPGPAPLATLGWISIGAHIAYIKIMFLLRILCLSDESVYRKLIVACVYDILKGNSRNEKRKSPVGSMVDCINQYGFMHILQTCIQEGTWEKIKGIKVKIKKAIYETDQARWKATCLMYNSLWAYNTSVTSIKLHPWWVFLRDFPATFKKVSCVLAVLSGTQPRKLQRNFSASICKLCVNSCRETSLHILFECTALNATREKLMRNVEMSMPQPMVESFSLSNNREKFLLCITGLNCQTYMREWAEIYHNIATFVYGTYMHRSTLYDELAVADQA